MHEFTVAVKEPSFDQNGDIPLEEHWTELINDESTLWKPLPKSLSNYADLRKSMIEWIFDLGDKLKQRSLTLQLAIVYVDKLLLAGKGPEMEKDKHLWGLTALYLASKYDELDRNIPFISDLRKVSRKAAYSWSEVTKCESNFINFLNWDIMIVSPLNYTYALLTFGVVFTTDKFSFKPSSTNPSSPEQTIENKIKSVRKYTEFFTDMALQSFECQKYKYSIQALSAVVAARKICKIEPVWNEELQRITNY